MFKNGKWQKRRSAHGFFMPILFLVFEILFYVLIVFIVSQLHMFLLTLLAALLAIYLFITSSLMRFRSVYYRQKFHKEDNTY